MAAMQPRPYLVGFAAETGDAAPRARKKLEAKRLDLVVANDVSKPDSGFDSETNEVTLVGPDGDEALPLMTKPRLASIILDRVGTLLTSAEVPVES